MNRKADTRSKLDLLTGVSALALALSAYPAIAGEPSAWIELGWQSDHVYTSRDSFALPLGSATIPSGLSGPLAGGLLLSHSYGEFGKLTYRPDDTHWVFSASVTFGRSTGKRRGVVDHTQPIPTTSFVTYHTTIPTYPFPYHRTRTKDSRVSAELIHVETVASESHHMVDFEAGYDVGLGLFGQHGTSTLGIGMRFAQLRSSLNIANFRALPDAHLEYFHSTFPTFAFFPSGTQIVPWYHNGYTQNWHSVAGNGKSAHDFAGYGPEIRWDASASLWGNAGRGGEISLDWALNAAMLFGKQKNKTQHQTVGNYYCSGHFCANYVVPYQNTAATRSERRVTVPDLGGSIGISYRFQDIKLSAGYRGDFFFRAIDTGTGHSITRGFQGPYASISIGLGD